MFPHPQHVITVRMFEVEHALAEADRIRRHSGEDLQSTHARRVPALRSTPASPSFPLLRRAARALSLLVG